jgi:predicted transcriptional regulator of viral defense system
VRLRFYQRGGISQLPVLTRPGGLGSFRLSSPELTALDVASDLGLSGGLDNAAGVVVGLNDAAGLDLREVAALAPWFPASGVRRLGWILEQFADAKGLGELRAAARAFDPTPSLLDPTGERRGKRDQGWNLVLNTEIEPEE